MANKLIILDRDGVINYDSKDYIKSPDEWRAIDGSLEAIKKLTTAGFTVIVATNQAGIGRGLFSEDSLHAIHTFMQQEIEKAGGKITDIFYCPHHPDDNCKCRKPKPGMLLEIADKYQIDINKICMVGDSPKDVAAAKACGAKPKYVLTSIHHKQLSKDDQDVPVFSNLLAFVNDFLAGQ